ncbi:MAG: nucleotidyltransferase family protein [Bacteroidota bacterium]
MRLIARADLDPEAVAELRRLGAEVDWERVLILAAYHRLLPLLHAHLKAHAPGLAPERAMAVLASHVRTSAVQSLFLSGEMGRIAEAFEARSIPLLVLKGPSLAEAYGGIAKRAFVDNDLLVRRQDFGEVEETLFGLGFRSRKRSQRQMDGYLFIHQEYTFGRAEGDLVSTVDVHTCVAPLGYTYQGAFEGLRRRSRELTIGGQAVRVLGWPDLFVALCVNALKDQWNLLRLASDVAVAGTMVDDWDLTESIARDERCLRAFRLGVLVAANEIGAAFPEAVLARARADAQAVGLADRVRAHFPVAHEEHVLEGRERAYLVLQAQDGLGGRARYLSYVALRRIAEPWVSPQVGS